jgi:hypothetical protein
VASVTIAAVPSVTVWVPRCRGAGSEDATKLDLARVAGISPR